MTPRGRPALPPILGQCQPPPEQENSVCCGSPFPHRHPLNHGSGWPKFPADQVEFADVFILAPGGIGTVLESKMIWQLLQVRYLCEIPLIFADLLWREFVDWPSRSM